MARQSKYRLPQESWRGFRSAGSGQALAPGFELAAQSGSARQEQRCAAMPVLPISSCSTGMPANRRSILRPVTGTIAVELGA
jgi:hypothetical protein